MLFRSPETQQGIGSLGPEPMEQQMPMPNRMGARFGGDMEELRPGAVDSIEKIKEKIIEGGDRAQGLPGVDESIWIEKLIEHLRKKRGERRDPREEFMPEWDAGPIRPLPRRPRRPLLEEEIGIESLRGRR